MDLNDSFSMGDRTVREWNGFLHIGHLISVLARSTILRKHEAQQTRAPHPEPSNTGSVMK